MTVTRLYLIRHGETAAAQEFRYEGRGDGDLTADGLQQAKRAAELLLGTGITALYSSPRLRAAHTARIIGGRLGLTPVQADGLAEVDFGRWEGLTMDEIRLHDPDLLRMWLADPVRVRPPGGENLAEMWERVRGFLKGLDLLPRDPALTDLRAAPPAARPGAVALVSHGGPIRALMSFCKAGDLSAFRGVTVMPGDVTMISAGQ